MTLLRSMPKWKEDAKQFTVGVNYSAVRGYQATIPKPVMARLGNPDRLTFEVKRAKVEVRAGEKASPEVRRGG